MRAYVRVNWIGRFFMAVVWGLLCLLSLSVVLRHPSDIDVVFGIGFAAWFGYLSVGAALNGARVFASIFRVRYGWRAEK